MAENVIAIVTWEINLKKKKKENKSKKREMLCLQGARKS